MSAYVICAGGKSRLWAVALIVAALLSTAIERSRAGGLAFAVFGAGLVFVGAYLSQGIRKSNTVLAGFAVLLLAGAAVVAVALKDDPRWHNMTSKIAAGFLGEAIQIECEGTASIEADITAIYGNSEESQNLIRGVRDGDGVRMVVLRAGMEMALKHPWGMTAPGRRSANSCFRSARTRHCRQRMPTA